MTQMHNKFKTSNVKKLRHRRNTNII